MQVERAKSGIENRCISEENKEWLGKCKIGMSDKSETAREVRKALAAWRKPIICSGQFRAQP